MDTPQPFLKIGDHIFVGAVTPLIGDEVVFDVIRRELSHPSRELTRQRKMIRRSLSTDQS